ncbi:E3 ubiquitin-protein ligase SINA-like 3 [Phragmites australis]|uniref:E3 ubiquitin-protein ligase SINA-like 3 n=1 Tax=Phragmites australis TaxID=29695 RepID=UPI002D77ED8A|nr:E3 ubiquitin-protein ligase SINA-like 3 [Phragmites australis]
MAGGKRVSSDPIKTGIGRGLCATKKVRPCVRGEAAAATNQREEEKIKITVAIDPELLECGVCFGPLTPPLFQCAKGHISCSECCTGQAVDYECLMCREPETATRCRAMERVLDGLSVPCAFRQHGCAKMIPYAEKPAHDASCDYAPCYCPIAGCAGGYAGATLRDHVELDHPAVHRTRVRPGCLTALRMRAGEVARMVCLGPGTAEFLLVVARDVPSGRALSVVRLMDEPFEEEFRYRIEVVGKAGVLSLSGQADGIDRLPRPYQARAFLFVPDAIWDSSPEDIPVFIELK